MTLSEGIILAYDKEKLARLLEDLRTPVHLCQVADEILSHPTQFGSVVIKDLLLRLRPYFQDPGGSVSIENVSYTEDKGSYAEKYSVWFNRKVQDRNVIVEGGVNFEGILLKDDITVDMILAASLDKKIKAYCSSNTIVEFPSVVVPKGKKVTIESDVLEEYICRLGYVLSSPDQPHGTIISNVIRDVGIGRRLVPTATYFGSAFLMIMDTFHIQLPFFSSLARWVMPSTDKPTLKLYDLQEGNITFSTCNHDCNNSNRYKCSVGVTHEKFSSADPRRESGKEGRFAIIIENKGPADMPILLQYVGQPGGTIC